MPRVISASSLAEARRLVMRLSAASPLARDGPDAPAIAEAVWDQIGLSLTTWCGHVSCRILVSRALVIALGPGRDPHPLTVDGTPPTLRGFAALPRSADDPDAAEVSATILAALLSILEEMIGDALLAVTVITTATRPMRRVADDRA